MRHILKDKQQQLVGVCLTRQDCWVAFLWLLWCPPTKLIGVLDASSSAQKNRGEGLISDLNAGPGSDQGGIQSKWSTFSAAQERNELETLWEGK